MIKSVNSQFHYLKVIGSLPIYGHYGTMYSLTNQSLILNNLIDNFQECLTFIN